MIVLIVVRSIVELPAKPFGEGIFVVFLGFIGQPVVALLIGVALAFLLPKKLEKAMLSSTGWVGEAIIAAATIIIIRFRTDSLMSDFKVCGRSYPLTVCRCRDLSVAGAHDRRRDHRNDG
jgi:hypothetical protein